MGGERKLFQKTNKIYKNIFLFCLKKINKNLIINFQLIVFKANNIILCYRKTK